MVEGGSVKVEERCVDGGSEGRIVTSKTKTKPKKLNRVGKKRKYRWMDHGGGEEFQ